MLTVDDITQLRATAAQFRDTVTGLEPAAAVETNATLFSGVANILEMCADEIARLQKLTHADLPDARLPEEDCFLIEAALTVCRPCNEQLSAFVVTETDLVRLLRCALAQDFLSLYPQVGDHKSPAPTAL